MSGNLLLLILVLWPFAGSFIIWLTGRGKKSGSIHYSALTVTVIELLLALFTLFTANSSGDAYLTVPYIEGFGLNFAFDGFRQIYLVVTVIMWLSSTAISREYFGEGGNLVRYYGLSMWTFAATVGVFLSADFITTFTFFEIMSLASYAFVAHTEKKESMRAAETYLAVAVIGGLVMLMGILMLYHETGTLFYNEIRSNVTEVLSNNPSSLKKIYVAGALILFGFGAKAGMFPLHIWLPKAHPVAPAPASALLSGVLTKSGIFGVLILCMEVFADDFKFGFTVLVLGVVTMLTGAVLAVFSVDLKRTLACSSVSQIGFILVGIGLIPMLEEECTLAMSGAMLYMVNHSMFKLTLFLAAAAIYMKCHMLNLNDLRGYGRDMHLLKVLFVIGALGISGVPMLSGYVSKTLIHEGIVEYIEMSGNLHGVFKTIEILFLMSGGMTFAYMMKIFHAVFVDEPEENCKYAGKDKKVSVLSYVAIVIPATVILIMGVCPKLFYGKIGKLMGTFNTRSFDAEQIEILENIKIFSWENLKGSLISLGIGCVFFILIRIFLTEGNKRKAPVYVDKWPKWLDLEELVYRPLLCGFFPMIFRTVGKFIATGLVKGIWKGIMWTGSVLGRTLANCFAKFVDFMGKTVFAEISPRKHTKLQKLGDKYNRAEEEYKIISSGISYGLLFICIGLCITLFYLLYLLFA